MGIICLGGGSTRRAWPRWACPPAATQSPCCACFPPWPHPTSSNLSLTWSKVSSICMADCSHVSALLPMLSCHCSGAIAWWSLLCCHCSVVMADCHRPVATGLCCLCSAANESQTDLSLPHCTIACSICSLSGLLTVIFRTMLRPRQCGICRPLTVYRGIGKLSFSSDLALCPPPMVQCFLVCAG